MKEYEAIRFIREFPVVALSGLEDKQAAFLNGVSVKIDLMGSCAFQEQNGKVEIVPVRFGNHPMMLRDMLFKRTDKEPQPPI